MIYETVSWPLSRAGYLAGGRQSGWRVSAASAIRWRRLVPAHGTPTTKWQGGDRRTPRIEDHAGFILAAIEQELDPTLAELREVLAERGVSTSIATLWRFFARHGITREKRPATQRSRIVPMS